MIRAAQARVILLAAIVVTGASTIALRQAPPQREKVSDEQYRAAAVK
jgi:hypothetical protein